jgi:hypothetical protein
LTRLRFKRNVRNSSAVEYDDLRCRLDIDDFHRNTETDGFSPHLDDQFAPVPPDLGGGTDFGIIAKEIADLLQIQSLPIRLVHGSHRGPNNGHGIRHILASHDEEMSRVDYWSVQDFVYGVATTFDSVYRDDRDPERLILARRADAELPHHRILVIELHKSGKCYSVITGWLRNGYRKIKGVLIWERRDRSPKPEAPSHR